jgi:hypothetical protein
LKRLDLRASQNIIGVKTDTYPFSEPAVPAPLAEQVTICPERSGKKHMSVRDTMGNPIEKLIEEVGFLMTGSYTLGDFRTNQIGCMLELG